VTNSNKNNFIVFGDSWEYLSELSDNQLGQLYRAQLEYVNGIEPEISDPEVKGIWRGIRHQMNLSQEKYESKCAKLRANASKSKQLQANANNSNQIEGKTKTIPKTKPKTIKNEIPNGISCAEPETASAPEADDLPFGEPEQDFMPEPIPDPVFITLPLVGNDSHEITETEVDEYKALYPAVDVEQELRNMRGWLMDNPTRRKTKRGIAAFVGNWLRKEQDRGKSAGGYTAPRSVPGRVDFQAWAEKMEAQERAKKEAAANGL